MAKKLFTPWENFSQFFTLGGGRIPKGKICIVVPPMPETILILLYALTFLLTSAFLLFLPRFWTRKKKEDYRIVLKGITTAPPRLLSISTVVTRHQPPDDDFTHLQCYTHSSK